MSKYLKTAEISLRSKTNGGLIYIFPQALISITYLLPLIFLWRVIASGENFGNDMTLNQLLTYTYINTLLAELLVVRTFISSWSYEGQLISLYARPLPIFGQIIAQTIGAWLPMLLCFSLPMLLIAPVFGINVTPVTLWFFPSLLLCVSLGFAIDFIFGCMTIRLRGMAWLSYAIRMAIVSLFSGTVIPFKLLPFGLTTIFEYQPFGSLGGAPLSVFVGTSDPMRTIAIQLIWNIILWPVAVYWFMASRERQVSYGG